LDGTNKLTDASRQAETSLLAVIERPEIQGLSTAVTGKAQTTVVIAVGIGLLAGLVAGLIGVALGN